MPLSESKYGGLSILLLFSCCGDTEITFNRSTALQHLGRLEPSYRRAGGQASKSGLFDGEKDIFQINGKSEKEGGNQ